jgi:hypothetical protein
MTRTKTITGTAVVWLSIPRARTRATCKSESAATVATMHIAVGLAPNEHKAVPHAQSD